MSSTTNLMTLFGRRADCFMEHPTETPQEHLPVCVIGAGVSGIAAAIHLREAGIRFDCFDERSSPGGIWSMTDQCGITSAWESLHLNSPRNAYLLSNLPMPPTYAEFPRAHEVWEYLNSCVDHFGLRDSMHFQQRVAQISKCADGSWTVRLQDGTENRYRAVVVANGHHNTPRIPDYPGAFDGTVMHSRDYRSNAAFSGQRVLVVGVGNSGSQIAVDVSRVADHVSLSTRRGVWVFPHFIAGRAFTVWFPLLPWWVIKPAPALFHRLMSLYYRALLGSPARLGMPEPDHDLGTALPTVCEGLFDQIEAGRIAIRPAVSSLEGSRARFTDDTIEPFDTIIYSTGYHTTFPFLDPEIFSVEDNWIQLFKRTFLPSDPTLCFVGATQGIGYSFTQMYEAQARLVAAHLAGDYQLPARSRMERDIQRDFARTSRQFHRTPRSNYQAYAPSFIHECETELRRGRRRARKFALTQ